MNQRKKYIFPFSIYADGSSIHARFERREAKYNAQSLVKSLAKQRAPHLYVGALSAKASDVRGAIVEIAACGDGQV